MFLDLEESEKLIKKVKTVFNTAFAFEKHFSCVHCILCFRLNLLYVLLYHTLVLIVSMFLLILCWFKIIDNFQQFHVENLDGALQQ